MIFEMLILFIFLTIFLFILSVFIMEDYPIIAIPLIMIGMILSILCAYGLWNVEWFYVGYNSTVGNSSGYIHSTMNYGDPYSYIFVLFFFLYCVLFVKTGFNMWREALRTKGELDLKNKRGR